MTFTTCTFLHVVVILRCKSQAGKDHTRLGFPFGNPTHTQRIVEFRRASREITHPCTVRTAVSYTHLDVYKRQASFYVP